MSEQLKIIISAEIAKIKQGVEEAKKQVQTFKDQVDKAAKDIDKKFKSMGASISSAAKTIAIGVAAIATALIANVSATEEYRNQQAQLITAFEAAGASAETAKETYNDLYRVLGDGGQAQEAAQHLAKLTKEEKALNQWTTICQGVYASFGASLPIESLTEAANETAKTGQLTGALADSLNWAGVNEELFQEKLDACNTEAEREQLIRETLNGLYADAALMYEENNAQVLAQRDAQAQLQSTLAEVGAAIAPVVTAFTSFAADALAVVTPYIQDLATNLLPILQELLSGLVTGLEASAAWIQEHTTLLTAIGVAIGIIVAAIGLYNAVAAIKAAMDAAQVTTIWALVAAHAAQAVAAMAAIAPYVLIVAAIAAVIAIIVLCVQHWDEIKAKVQEVWEAMVSKIQEAAENVKAKVSEMVEKVVSFFTNLKTKIQEAVLGAKTAVVEKFNEIKQNITDKVNAAKEAVSTAFDNIKSGITEKINSAKTTVTTAVSSIYTSIKSKFESAKSTVTSIFDSIKSKIEEKINAAKTAVSNAIESIKQVFKFEWSLPKLKLPRISITGNFSLSPLSVPKFSITWNKLGGIFDKPTLFNYGGSLQGIGEDGAEAVVPLEKNTQWLDKIAERLAAKQGSMPIVLNVDGKTFAQVSIDSINQLTRQTGSLGLAIV